MKTKTIAASIAAALSLAAFAPTASAEAGQWFGHLRLSYIDPADESPASPALEAPSDQIDVTRAEAALERAKKLLQEPAASKVVAALAEAALARAKARLVAAKKGK